jgi:preprotein translocase subunit SecG
MRLKLTDSNSRYLVNAHLTAAIVILVLIQRRNGLGVALSFKYEAAKSILATIIWFLLLLDAVFMPDYQKDDKIIKANASIIIVLYVPSKIWNIC